MHLCMHCIGFVFYYTLVQSSMWGLLHTVFLFWAVVFPFSYRQLRISGRIRYAHIISVVLAVVIPLPAPLAHLKDGYVLLIINPPLTCLGRNTTITFFTYILTISIILAAVSCQLVIIFSTIFKVNSVNEPKPFLLKDACFMAMGRSIIGSSYFDLGRSVDVHCMYIASFIAIQH